MKIASVVTMLFGLFLLVLALGLFQSLITIEDDDFIFYLFGMIFSAFGGICFIAAGFEDYIKSKH